MQGALRRGAVATLVFALGTPALAGDVVVTDAWIRATVPSQQATGAYLNIVSSESARLVGAQSPVAGITELHTMKLVGGIMRMRGAPQVNLPANQTVSLKPGGTHVMLMKLKQPVTVGSFVPLTLTIESSGGEQQQVEIQVPVKPITHSPR